MCYQQTHSLENRTPSVLTTKAVLPTRQVVCYCNLSLLESIISLFRIIICYAICVLWLRINYTRLSLIMIVFSYLFYKAVYLLLLEIIFIIPFNKFLKQTIIIQRCVTITKFVTQSRFLVMNPLHYVSTQNKYTETNSTHV